MTYSKGKLLIFLVEIPEDYVEESCCENQHESSHIDKVEEARGSSGIVVRLPEGDINRISASLCYSYVR